MSSVDGRNERYTPSDIIESARRVFGGTIDLDPASCLKANHVVKAEEIRTMGPDPDALDPRMWNGDVWCNPPGGRTQGGRGSRALIWYERALKEIATANILFMAFNVELLRLTQKTRCDAFTFPVLIFKKRIRFTSGVGADESSPANASALICMTLDEEIKARFRVEFASFGRVVG